ncbi:MAG: hypothetical protein ACYC1L_15635, partial [Alphaproteobacteria bacterium]
LRGMAHCSSCADAENQPPDSSRHWMKVGGNVNGQNRKLRLEDWGLGVVAALGAQIGPFMGFPGWDGPS